MMYSASLGSLDILTFPFDNCLHYYFARGSFIRAQYN